MLGRVRAGGFAAIVTPGVPGRSASGDRGAAETPPPAPAASVTAPDLGADEGGRRLEGLAALRAATGGDWMEESLGLGPPRAAATRGACAVRVGCTATPGGGGNRVGQPRAGASAGDVDDEVTLGGDDEPLPSATRTPPVWPGDPATAGSPISTLIPDRDVPEPAPVTPASSRLRSGASCPPVTVPTVIRTHRWRMLCRVCGAAIDAAAPTVAILQPVLGRLVLDDGESSAIDRALVLGRRPDAAVAGMPAGSRLIAVGSAATVSRTHAVVRADGWTVTVTDCGSRSGTAVLMPDGDEPLLLQPWIPHEVPVDARIFLGGPTSVSIEASGGAPQ